MESLKQLAKLLWLTSGVLCIMVFIYQATPILLNSLDPSWLRVIAIFLTFFGLYVAVMCSVLLFSWLSEELKARKHELAMRRRPRTARQSQPQRPPIPDNIRRFPARH